MEQDLTYTYPGENTSSDTREISCRPLRRGLRLKIGRALFRLTHPDYRKEVTLRSEDIAWALHNTTSEYYRKHVLPPHSVPGTIDAMREASQMLAYDIVAQLKNEHDIPAMAIELHEPLPDEPPTVLDYSVVIELAPSQLNAFNQQNTPE